MPAPKPRTEGDPAQLRLVTRGLGYYPAEMEMASSSEAPELRPCLAARLRVLRGPNPAIRTSSSFARDSAIASRTESTAPSAVYLFSPIRLATRATTAALFIVDSSDPPIAP